MEKQLQIDRSEPSTATSKNRSQLLDGLPVEEQRLALAGLSSAVLIGGEGLPVVLLHGPGETSLWWMRVIPRLVQTNRVIIPDLPGHGATEAKSDIDEQIVLSWLDELIDQTCTSPPALVGHLLGGAIAARFAIAQGERLSHLVLVDSFGLGKFRPAPRFAFGLIRFLVQPSEKNYSRFLPKCIFDADDLRRQMGKNWQPFLGYNLECARNSDSKAAMRLLMKKVGTPQIPATRLEKINVPTSLIWGRHDLANRLPIAEAAAKRYGWPLHIIADARDDPKIERPDPFVDALHLAIKKARTGAPKDNQ